MAWLQHEYIDQVTELVPAQGSRPNCLQSDWRWAHLRQAAIRQQRLYTTTTVSHTVRYRTIRQQRLHTTATVSRTVRYAKVRYGPKPCHMRYGTIRYGTVPSAAANTTVTVSHRIRNGTVCMYDTIRYGTVRYGTVRYGTLRYISSGHPPWPWRARYCTDYGTVRYRTHYGTVRCGILRYGTPAASGHPPRPCWLSCDLQS